MAMGLLFAVIMFLVATLGYIMVNTFKNFFVALTAYLLGDRQLRDDGFLTLNPLRQTNISTIAAAMAILVGGVMLFGNSSLVYMLSLITMNMTLVGSFRRPIPVDEKSFKHPMVGQVITLLAAPFGSFFFSFLITAFARIVVEIFNLNAVSIATSPAVALFQICAYQWGSIGTFLTVFELVPLPQFAAGRIIYFLLEDDFEELADMYFHYGGTIMLIISFVPFFFTPFYGALSLISTGLHQMIIDLLT